MGRPLQKFVAPGPDDQALPTPASPWHDGRWVRIPQEHWDLILDFAAKLDETIAARLRSLSWAGDDNDMDYVYASPQELESLLRFIARLAGEIGAAEPLVPQATEEVPDRYVKEEHVRMLNAIAAVFLESIRLGQPFRAWSE